MQEQAFLILDFIFISRFQATIRCLAARALREVASSHPDAYRMNLNAFILPLFETEADGQKEVSPLYLSICFHVQELIEPVIQSVTSFTQ